METVDSGAITDYAVMFARSLLLSKHGKAAGYWEKPLIGKPRVTGSAYVIGTYTMFILGCPLAGLRSQSIEQLPLLPEAESLVEYFLQYPTTKEMMDAHWKNSNEYAKKNLPSDLVDSIGDARSLFTQPGIGVGRADEKILTVYWQIMERGRAFTIEQGIEAFVSHFIYGTCVSPGEVRRLWGIQAQSSVVPFMEQPLENAQMETVAEINSLLGRTETLQGYSYPSDATA